MENKLAWKRPLALILVLTLVITYLIPYGTSGQMGESRVNLSLSFDGVGQGLDPKGNRFDINDIKSDLVLNDALEKADLKETLTVAELRSLIAIVPAVGDSALSQFTSLSASTGKTEAVKEKKVFPSQFQLVLKDRGVPTAIRDHKLLAAVAAAYRDYLKSKYLVDQKVEPTYSTEEILEMDYPEASDSISQKTEALVRYANGFAKSAPQFVAEKSGVSFSDYYEQSVVLNNVDAKNIDGIVNYFVLTKDVQRRIKYEEVMLKRANLLVSKMNGTEYTIYQILSIYNNNSNFVFASESAPSIDMSEQENQFYNDLASQLLVAKSSTIDAKYEKSDILKAIDKLKTQPVTSDQYVQRIAETETSMKQTLEKTQALHQKIRALAEEYYDSNIGDKVVTGKVSYHMHQFGNPIMNFLILVILWWVIIAVSRSRRLQPYFSKGQAFYKRQVQPKLRSMKTRKDENKNPIEEKAEQTETE